MADAIVIGGGVGGMAAALALRGRGHDVLLLEATGRLGGKLGERRRDGFRWDTGPSLLTMPEVIDTALRGATGRGLAERVGLVRLDPVCRHHFADGSRFDLRADLDATVAEAERLRAGNGAAMRAWHARSARILAVAEHTFLAGPMTPAALARGGPGALRGLAAIDAVRTLDGRAGRTFADPRLRQWAGRYATYSGSSPYRAPATLACISALEQDRGGWTIRGGLARLADAMGDALAAAGVEVRTGTPVSRLTTGPGGVDGVETAAGERIAAGAVVAAVDAERLYADLLPRPRALRRVRAAGRSSSGFTLLLGLRGRTPGATHHTVLFGADLRAEFDAVHGRGEPAGDPTVYLCTATATDPGAAPPGDESVMALVNVPGEGRIDWSRRTPAYAEQVLDVLARRGFDLRSRIAVLETIDPDDLAGRHGSPGGAIYGTGSNGRRAAFLRPGNRGAARGLFLAGGSSHPGGGLPLVALGGGFAAALADAHLRARR